MMMLTVLGGIPCNKATLGRTACYAPTRYSNDDFFREHYPEFGPLRSTFTCIVEALNKPWFYKAYRWEEARCSDKRSFCGVERIDKQTGREPVRVHCMEERKQLQGDPHWFNANPDVIQKDIDALGNRAKYMSPYAVTNHSDVRKSDVQHWKLVNNAKDYDNFLQKLSDEEKKRRHIEPKTSKKNTITQGLANLGAKIGISNKEKQPRQQQPQPPQPPPKEIKRKSKSEGSSGSK